MAEELMVVLRRSDSCGLGFSLLGTAGLPPIIYDIIENSPAAESGEVSISRRISAGVPGCCCCGGAAFQYCSLLLERRGVLWKRGA
ncbi:PH and SEC7 domain-containing protein-like [Schistocerca nitens]|uniref:PH and SEC7 domain-containing protein-like n=1 Tax=Schistocerca nitens TaxID=7011 RepID=UPI00211893EF|nr:PH and SEC7 domain-containing protein-like [Schistocerca nitens]